MSEKTDTPPMTDTDRLNALFTMFGGHYGFSPFFEVQQVFRDGRRGIDALIAENPSLLGNKGPRLGIEEQLNTLRNAVFDLCGHLPGVSQEEQLKMLKGQLAQWKEVTDRLAGAGEWRFESFDDAVAAYGALAKSLSDGGDDAEKLSSKK